GAGRPSPRRAPWIRPGRLSRATYIRRLTRGAAAHSCRCSTSREGRMADYSLAATDVALHGVTLEEGVADTVTVATTADYVLMVHPGATEPVNVGLDRKSTRLNSSHVKTSYAVSSLKKKTPASP